MPPATSTTDSSNVSLAGRRDKTYEAFEGLLFLAKVPLSVLRKAHSRYRRLVNPQLLPHLYVCAREETLALFSIYDQNKHNNSIPNTQNKKTNNVTSNIESPQDAARTLVIHSLCESLTSKNGQMDILDVFAGLCMLGRGEGNEKLRFLFDLFDLDESGDVSEDELVMLFRSVQWFSCQVGMVQDTASPETLEKLACQIVQTYGNALQETIDLEQFQFALTDGKELLGSFAKVLEFVQTWSRSFFQLEDKVNAYTTEMLGGSLRSTVNNNGKNSTGNVSTSREAPFAVMPIRAKDQDPPILWGPVVFPLCGTSVEITLQVNAGAIVHFHVCLGEAVGTSVSALEHRQRQLLLPQLPGYPHLFQTRVLEATANFDTLSVIVDELCPDTKYTVVLVGVSQQNLKSNSRASHIGLPQISFITPPNSATCTCVGAMIERACQLEKVRATIILGVSSNDPSVLMLSPEFFDKDSTTNNRSLTPNASTDTDTGDGNFVNSNDVNRALAQAQQWWLPKLLQTTKGLLPSAFCGVFLQPNLSHDSLCDKLEMSAATYSSEITMLVDGLRIVAQHDRTVEQELMCGSEDSDSRPATPTSIGENTPRVLPEPYLSVLHELHLLSPHDADDDIRLTNNNASEPSGSETDIGRSSASLPSNQSIYQSGMLVWQKEECKVVRVRSNSLMIFVVPGRTRATIVSALSIWLATLSPPPTSLLLMTCTPLLGATLPDDVMKIIKHAHNNGSESLEQHVDGDSLHRNPDDAEVTDRVVRYMASLRPAVRSAVIETMSNANWGGSEANCNTRNELLRLAHDHCKRCPDASVLAIADALPLCHPPNGLVVASTNMHPPVLRQVTMPFSGCGILPPFGALDKTAPTDELILAHHPGGEEEEIRLTFNAIESNYGAYTDSHTKMVLGPVVGRVSPTRCVLLIEMNTACTVVCTATPYTNLSSAHREQREISQTLTCLALRPARILLTNLAPGTLHEVVFRVKSSNGSLVNLTKGSTAITACFRTVGSSHGQPANESEGSVWGIACFQTAVVHDGTGDALKHVLQAAACQEGCMVGLVHMGGQVDMRATFRRCLHMALDVLIPTVRLGGVLRGSTSDVASTEIQDITKRIKAEMRATYRAQWSRPGMRQMLSRGWNEMMIDPEFDLGLGGISIKTLCKNMTEISEVETENPQSPAYTAAWQMVKACAVQVYEEYQGQLMNLKIGNFNSDERIFQENEQHSKSGIEISHEISSSCSRMDVRMLRYGQMALLLVSHAHGHRLYSTSGHTACCSNLDGDDNKTKGKHETAWCPCVQLCLSRALVLWGNDLSRVVVFCNPPSADKHALYMLMSNRVFMQRCLKPLWLWKTHRRQQNQVCVDVIVPCKCPVTLECAHSSSDSHVGGGVQHYPARFLALRSLNSQGVHPSTGDVLPTWAKSPYAARIAFFAAAGSCQSTRGATSGAGRLLGILGSPAGGITGVVDVGSNVESDSSVDVGAENSDRNVANKIHPVLVQTDNVTAFIERVLLDCTSPPFISLQSTAQKHHRVSLNTRLEAKRLGFLAILQSNEWLTCAAKCAYHIHYVAQHYHNRRIQPATWSKESNDGSPTSAINPGRELLPLVPTDPDMSANVSGTTQAQKKNNPTLSDNSLLTSSKMEELFVSTKINRTQALLKPSQDMQDVLARLWLEEVKLKDLIVSKERLSQQARTAENNSLLLQTQSKQLQKEIANNLMAVRQERLTKVRQRQITISDEITMRENLEDVVKLCQEAADAFDTYSDDIIEIKNNVEVSQRKAAIMHLTQNGVAGGNLMKLAKMNADAFKFISETAEVLTKKGKLKVKLDATFDFEILKTKRLLLEFAVATEAQLADLEVRKHKSTEKFCAEMVQSTKELTKWQSSVSVIQQARTAHVESLSKVDEFRNACEEAETGKQEARGHITELRREYVCMARAYDLLDGYWMQALVTLNVPIRLSSALVMVWEAIRQEDRGWRTPPHDIQQCHRQVLNVVGSCWPLTYNAHTDFLSMEQFIDLLTRYFAVL